MRLISMNVGKPRTVTYKDKAITTGIFKEPVGGSVWLGRLNLEGDGQADLQAHGGEHKAVYVYPAENYEFWEKELGRDDLTPGNFGENFTVEGMREDVVHVGDVFRIGDALLEVSQPRVPCYKLELRLGVSPFVKRFMESNRVGYYLRVLEEGEVGAGDPVEQVKEGPERMTVEEVHRLLYFDKEKEAGAARAIRIPALSPGWRGSFEKILGISGSESASL